MLKLSLKKSFPNREIDEGYFFSRVGTLKQYIKENNATVYAVKNEIGLLGFIWFFVKVSVDEKVIHIVHFIVDEKHRGYGVGTKLLNKVEEYSFKKDIGTIELLVTKDNNEAVKFYENRDFQIERFVMKKRLLK